MLQRKSDDLITSADIEPIGQWCSAKKGRPCWAQAGKLRTLSGWGLNLKVQGWTTAGV